MDKWKRQRWWDEDDGDVEGTLLQGAFQSSANARSSRWRTAFLILVLLNVVVVVVWIFRPQEMAPNTLFTPAIKAISYSKERIWRPLDGNPFTGEPKPELDAAWRELIKPMAIKINEQEARKLGAETIAFKDGSGYMAEMAAFHELHCIKRIKQHLSLDYYNPNMTVEKAEAEVIHIDHCLEYLRRAAMCRGDTSLATFFWAKDGKPKSRNWSDHICVDWDELYDFALDRSVFIEDYSQLVGPDGSGGQDSS